MIRIVRAPVASSVQDLGRTGHRAEGHARSGAMDPLALTLANRAAGATPGAGAIELGPGPCEIEATRAGTVAFGGARRDGAPWWRTLELRPGDRIALSPPRDGVWSYLAVAGGVDAPLVLGSRATCVREGIGGWLSSGDEIAPGADAAEPADVEAPALRGPVRVYGALPGAWRVGRRTDRMGYQLVGDGSLRGGADEWSEPLLPGFVQLPPSGEPFVLMPEGPTVGGYPVAAIVHSDDLRLIAQTPTGEPVTLISLPSPPPERPAPGRSARRR